jgi:hypothetical protein
MMRAELEEADTFRLNDWAQSDYARDLVLECDGRWRESVVKPGFLGRAECSLPYKAH